MHENESQIVTHNPNRTIEGIRITHDFGTSSEIIDGGIGSTFVTFKHSIPKEPLFVTMTIDLFETQPEQEIWGAIEGQRFLHK